MDFNTLAAVLLNTASNGTATASKGSSIWMIALLVFFVVYMFMMSRRDKKQRKEEQDMRESLNVGDDIMTIGGIMGRVVSVKEDSVIIETGTDRTKIRFSKTAIATNISAKERAEVLKKEAAEKKEAEKAAKKKEKEKKNK